MISDIGSIWRKWDFHVHTPYSILNNMFGWNPFETDTEEKFDEYVRLLFTKAVEKDVFAIGITDYFMIEGYKRIKEKYLANPAKMQVCFPDDTLREKVEQIYIFPNIELRINNFIGENAHPVNFHVIFSDKVSIQDIEDNFLHRLTFSCDNSHDMSLTISNMQNVGQIIKRNNGNLGSDLLVGLQHVTVKYDDIFNVLNINDRFKEKYIITVPVDEDLSHISWDGRDYLTRQHIYKECHCLMTSNVRTINWALAQGEEERRIQEFGSIKPCIWGSDAHDYTRMFEPDNNKYCWIKADTTFDGLQQILYEPAGRVSIQQECPNNKDPHQIIQSIQFNNISFQSVPIIFNDYLTCIIGGKSTGKSLLLHQLASTINPEYVREKERTVSERKEFLANGATVTWKDGTHDIRGIVYIPQTFLNRTVDNEEQSTEINQIVGSVLKQEPDIAAAYTVFRDTVDKIKSKTKTDILTYINYFNKNNKLQKEILDKGTVETFSATISFLEKERKKIASKVDITQDKIDKYAYLEKQCQKLIEEKNKLTLEKQRLTDMKEPMVIIPGYFEVTSTGEISNQFEDTFKYIAKDISDAVESMTGSVKKDWNTVYDCIIEKVNKLLATNEKQLETVQTQYNNLKVKVEQNDQLQKISARIVDENQKLQETKKRETLQKDFEFNMDKLQNNIIATQTDFYNAYNTYCDVVNTIGTSQETVLKFEAKVIWKQEDFIQMIGTIFNNRNFSAFRSETSYNLIELTPEQYGIEFLQTLWKSMSVVTEGGSLAFKTSFSLDNVLFQIFDNWYNVHYVVMSENDTIEDMSLGKKALVLLELLINLEDSSCPILIDQPEDDLDNRSIYNDLVQYIKKKKNERQIIIVTHNANVVLGADAEEIIIANQDGHDAENAKDRFEYRSGSIENDEILYDEQGNLQKGILNHRGIQTQICDILEGGRTAFEKRQNKYKMVT